MCLDAKQVEVAKNEYKMVCEIEGKSEKTIEHNMMVIGFVQKYVSGGELTEAAVRGFLAEVAGRRKMTTVNSYARAFRTFCHFLVNEGYVNADPMMNIKTPKIPRKFPSVLSEEDIKRLISAAKPNVRDYAIVLFLLDTGVRAGELVNLTLDDIDLKRFSARVFGKGSKERIVFFSKKTARALAKWLSVRPVIPLEDAVFTSERKDKLTVSGLRLVFKRLQRKAGLEGIHQFNDMMSYVYICDIINT